MSSVLPPTYRPWDTLYIIFFMSYIPIIIFFDCLALYPKGVAPPSLLSLNEWYKTHFNDQLVITQPPWFRLFTLSEFLYQLPVAAWGIWALRLKSPKAPLHILLWAVICFGTTVTCLFEFYHNNLMTSQEKTILSVMYGSYAVIFGAIGADMFYRIQKILQVAASVGEQKRVQ